MSSFLSRKWQKIRKRLVELETEAKELAKQSEEIVEKCSAMVEKLTEPDDTESYMEEYIDVYSHLSNCVTHFSEFNCKMESLRLGKDYTLHYLNIQTNPEANSLDDVDSVTGSSADDSTTGTTNTVSEDVTVDSSVVTDESQTSVAQEPPSDNPPETPVRQQEPSFHRSMEKEEDGEERIVSSKEPPKCFSGVKIDRGVGAVHDVMLSHVVSPDEFYVFVECQELRLMNELMEKLRVVNRSETAYDNPLMNGQAKKRFAADAIGSYGLAFCKELQRWARVKVLDWRFNKNDNIIRVLYIDHGFSELISLRATLPMSETVRDYPAFVEKCYLSSIFPVGEKWSKEDITMFELFTESIENKSQLRIEITESNAEDGAIGVKLFLSDSRICVNDKLVEFEIATSCGGFSRKSVPLSGWYLPPCPIGETIPVKVTCVVGVNQIFCVRDYARTGESDVLQNLTVYLNGAKTQSRMSRLAEPPSVGDFVVARYEDGFWYRAQVLTSRRDNCRVIFLDYGNTDDVATIDLRKMEPEYLKIPFQMVECHVEDVELKWEADLQKAVNYLNERVAEDVTIKIRRVLDAARSVYSVVIYDKNGDDIADELVSAGHVVRRNCNC